MICLYVKFHILYTYYNGFDQPFARQQICKDGPIRNNRGRCVSRVCGDVTQQWIETK
jgi:hypothetical protein